MDAAAGTALACTAPYSDLPFEAITMDSKPNDPLRLFYNPFVFWTDLALRTGQAIWGARPAGVNSNVPAKKVAVIPTPDAPAPNAKVAVLPAANAPRKARPTVRHASKAVRSRTTRAKPRSKANAKRRTRR